MPVQAALKFYIVGSLQPIHWTLLLFACGCCLFYTVPMERGRSDSPFGICNHAWLFLRRFYLVVDSIANPHHRLTQPTMQAESLQQASAEGLNGPQSVFPARSVPTAALISVFCLWAWPLRHPQSRAAVKARPSIQQTCPSVCSAVESLDSARVHSRAWRPGPGLCRQLPNKGFSRESALR